MDGLSFQYIKNQMRNNCHYISPCSTSSVYRGTLGVLCKNIKQINATCRSGEESLGLNLQDFLKNFNKSVPLFFYIESTVGGIRLISDLSFPIYLQCELSKMISTLLYLETSQTPQLCTQTVPLPIPSLPPQQKDHIHFVN